MFASQSLIVKKFRLQSLERDNILLDGDWKKHFKLSRLDSDNIVISWSFAMYIPVDSRSPCVSNPYSDSFEGTASEIKFFVHDVQGGAISGTNTHL